MEGAFISRRQAALAFFGCAYPVAAYSKTQDQGDSAVLSKQTSKQQSGEISVE
jgi:hypothetical protein